MGVRKKIKIIGGGFSGVKCALTLRKQLSREEADIILYNSENYLVFQPLLAEVVGASISPEPVAVPLRQMLPGVYCRTEDITKIDVKNNIVEYFGDEGQRGQMVYDHLVIACGSSVNLGLIPGMSDHAFPLKTVGDAVALRYHVMQQMENAEICEDVYRRRWHLSFVIVRSREKLMIWCAIPESFLEIYQKKKSKLRLFIQETSCCPKLVQSSGILQELKWSRPGLMWY